MGTAVTVRRVGATMMLLLLASACGTGDTRAATGGSGPATTSNPTPPSTVGFEELQDLNRRYADRLPFTGDAARAVDYIAKIRQALVPLANAPGDAGVDEVKAVLAPLVPSDAYLQVATNAVRVSGTAFGVWIGDGCIFGAISQGQLTVDVSGPVRDGGCLATYAH